MSRWEEAEEEKSIQRVGKYKLVSALEKLRYVQWMNKKGIN